MRNSKYKETQRERRDEKYGSLMRDRELEIWYSLNHAICSLVHG